MTASSAPQQPLLRRRRVLVGLSAALAGLAGLAVASPVVAFVVAPLFRGAPDKWQPVGPVDRFQVGETVEVTLDDPSSLPWAGVTADSAVWLRRVTDATFVAFSIHCTHLGCPVRWIASAELFMCPCHGGVFYSDGTVAAGPPPAPLPQVAVRVNNGTVEVLLSAVPITTGSLPGSG